jgi:hypothetical protein
LARVRCLPLALALGTLVPVAVAIGDNLVRSSSGDRLWIAVVLILGTPLSVLMSAFFWLLSTLWPPERPGSALVTTLLACTVWIAIAALLMLTGPYSQQITANVLVRYLTIAAYGSSGALAFFTALFLCRQRFG